MLALAISFSGCSKADSNASKNDFLVEDKDDGVKDEESEDKDEEKDEEKVDDGIVDILALDYKIVYDPYELGMEDLAKELQAGISKKCGTELSICDYSRSKKEEYRIFVGKISSFSDSSFEIKRLSEEGGKYASAFSIRFSGNTLMISGTKKQAVKLGAQHFISLIKNGELKLSEDFYITKFLSSDESGDFVFSEEEFDSSAFLAEITLKGKKLDGFGFNTTSYEYEYPSSENYPIVDAKPLNPNATVKVTPAGDESGFALISVTAADGKTSMDYTIDFKYKENSEIFAEVVNKDGKSGVVTFVFDDGDLRSADIIISKLMKKYPSIRPSFGVITNQLASVERQGGGFKLTPLEYSYYPISNSLFSRTNYKYEFWQAAASVSGVDILSHSHSHTHDGVMADPALELAASQLVLRELCGVDCLAYVMPGVGTITNSAYFETLDSGEIYIGARSTGGGINYPKSYNPYRVLSYAVTRHSTKLISEGVYTTNENSSKDLCLKAGIELWENHINNAIENGAWAAFCIHGIVPLGLDSDGKWVIYEEQLDALFKYADELSKNGDVWIANFTEASIYYREWKESKVNATISGDSSVFVELTTALDTEVFNMPLTVKVPIPKTWTSANTESEELSVFENQDGTKFVYLSIAPGESLTITK